MNDATVRLIQNSREAFRRFTWEQLYHTARGLRDELAFRDVDCLPEADALLAALLGHAQVEHRAIFCADCAPALPTIEEVKQRPPEQFRSLGAPAEES